MNISTRLLAPALLGMSLLSLAGAAQAAPLLSNAVAIGAVGAIASSNFGAPYTISRTIDQSDLSGTYVSGVTSAAVVGGFTNLNTARGWHGAANVLNGTIVYDLGGLYTLDRVYLFWMNAGSANNIAGITVDVSSSASFAQFSTVGNLTAPTGPKNEVDFTSLATGQYVRLNWSALQGNYPGLNEFIAGGVTAAVPEPATWALMIAGFGMVSFSLRRRAKVSTPVTYA